MAHLLNEPILAVHDSAGRLTSYEWRGSRYAVDALLKTYYSAGDGRLLHRVRVSGADGVAVAELAEDTGQWRLRHVFPA